MWKDYFAELLGAETLETAEGFVCFCLLPDSLYIEHIYFKPEARGLGKSHKLFDEVRKIAREKKRTLITASLDQERVLTWQQSLKAQLNAGFKISAVSGSTIYTYLKVGENHQ